MIHVVAVDNRFVICLMYKPVVNLTKPIEGEFVIEAVWEGTRTEDAKEILGRTESTTLHLRGVVGMSSRCR